VSSSDWLIALFLFAVIGQNDLYSSSENSSGQNKQSIQYIVRASGTWSFRS